MKRLFLWCSLTVFAWVPAGAQDTPQNDLDVLSELSQKFVDSFNDRNAEAIAKLFVPDGEIVLASGTILIGQDDLTDHYTNVFASGEAPLAALEASSVRFVTPSVATEDGTIHLTYESGEVSSHFYTTVQLKQEDGSWLYASVRDEEGDHALHSEKLLALGWLIGDWVIQSKDADTWISFQWSESGPYIDAKLLTETAGVQATGATFRIGWNERSESFNSWAFDDQGGFVHSSWIEAGPDEWILKSNGVTSDGETHNATQTIALDESEQSFIWAKRDQIIGGELLPERTARAVKQPPSPSTASLEAE
ncbi:MAG: nuclear transport factor 2 family protein [Verrucomicrobiota bacterium]